MQNRQKHQHEIHSFLQKHLSIREGVFSRPGGTGMETYFIHTGERGFFIKVGAAIDRYLTMAEMGLTPPVLASGQLEDGLSVIVQPLIDGRKPSQNDYWDQLEKVAKLIRTMHHNPEMKRVLPPASSELHRDMGLRALSELSQKWERHKAQVPKVSAFVEKRLEYLREQINFFCTEGLVASHNDICNANWLFTANGKIYVVDLDSMSREDPALDLGTLLWWYYPPESRARFLEITGYPYDDDFKFRMQLRRSMHCLYITLPREGSFERFDPDRYSEKLEDFRASLEGKENPKGYGGW